MYPKYQLQIIFVEYDKAAVRIKQLITQVTQTSSNITEQ